MRILAAQIDFTVGDLAGNGAKLADLVDRHGDDVDLIVCSELAVSGYYPYDLLDRPGFVSDQMAVVESLRESTRGRRASLALSHFEAVDDGYKPLRNVISVFADGERRFRVEKALLATYDVFDEDRHFGRGPVAGPRVCEIAGVRVALAVCEDAWYRGNDSDADPVTHIAAERPELVVLANGSPSNLGKIAQRRRLFSDHARRTGCPWLYLNQVGGNDELVFDGGGFAVMPAAPDPVVQLPWFEEAERVLEFEQGVFGDPVEVDAPPDDVELMRRQTVLGLQGYLTKCGFEGVVVGASGGIDSALTLALAVDAIGADRVSAVTMPGPYSSTGSVEDSRALCEALGVPLAEAPITDEYHAVVAAFEAAYGEMPSDLTRQNIQARLRGVTLMALSNHTGRLVLSTGNKSEMAVGYATLYGDMNGGLNLLGDLYKTEVYALAEHVNRRAGRDLIPRAIIEKAPSAELAPDQTDADSLPDYAVLDAILRLYIEGDQLDDAQRADCERVLDGVDDATVSRLVGLVDRAEFKRRQAPPIIRVHARAFGDGRRLPVAQRYRDGHLIRSRREGDDREIAQG